MLVRHATPRKNLKSINKGGLQTKFARGARPLVWVHTASKSPWAILHTACRHLTKAEDVVVIELDIPRSWLKRFRKGLWTSSRDIPAARIVRTLELADVAASAAE